QEQQPQGLRKANEDKTDNYRLDRWYVVRQAEFSDPFRDQNVKTPEPKSDHRDAAESDHIGEDSSLHGHLLPLPPPAAMGIGGALVHSLSRTRDRRRQCGLLAPRECSTLAKPLALGLCLVADIYSRIGACGVATSKSLETK